MKDQLGRVSPFTPDGRLKTGLQRRLDNTLVFDTTTGELKTTTKGTIDSVSKIDRVTGLPKGA